MHFLFMLALVGLGFFIARRRYGYGRFAMYGGGDGAQTGGPQMMDRWERKMARAQGKIERVRSRMERGGCGANWFAPSTSGNHAFDDYRAETLRRLEDEQKEFHDFLGRLRAAKDRARVRCVHGAAPPDRARRPERAAGPARSAGLSALSQPPRPVRGG